MEKLTISLDNIHPLMRDSLRPLLEQKVEQSANKITLSNTDVQYVEHLIKERKLEEARSVMNNLKSVAKIINQEIMITESYLASLEL